MPKRKKENYNYNKKKTTHLAFESKHNKSDKQKEKKIIKDQWKIKGQSHENVSVMT